MKWNGSTWSPATDDNTTYTASSGLTLTGTAFSANSSSAMWNASQIQGRNVANTMPSNGHVLKWNGSNWAPATDNGSTLLSRFNTWASGGGNSGGASGGFGVDYNMAGVWTDTDICVSPCNAASYGVVGIAYTPGWHHILV